jgi:uncharacterized membrane protein YjgN (DUF898 family)
MEAKLKHLEFIQAVITRMAQNSFLIKGWCVTLVSALYALAAKDANVSYVLVSYIAIPCFWILDGFFIAVERRYRKLYAEAAKKPAAETDFGLDASHYDKDDATWISGVFSKTLLVFYPFMVVIALVVMFALPHITKDTP